MNKQILSSLTILSLLLTPALRADSPSSPTEEVSPSGSSLDNTAPLAVDPVSEEAAEEQGASVGKASTDGMSTAKKKQWVNVAIAVGAVAVAVVALILVSSNEGHKSKK